MVIADACSKFVHVAFLEDKSQAKIAWRRYLGMVQRNGYTVRRLFTDNGSEFANADFAAISN